jgi:hypothetical protein
MIKKLITLLLAAAITVTGYSQAAKPGDIVITPGVGVGTLKLGMSEAAAYKVLKGDLTWKSYKEEMNIFKGYGSNFSIDSIPQFVLGFDSCAAYGNKLPAALPVYSLYFSAHKLIYITVTTYGVPEAQAKKVVLKNGIRFFGSMAACTAKMKSKYLKVRYEGYDGDHVYYNEGLEFTYDNKKLTTIGVFTPTPDFVQKMTDKSAGTLKDFEEAGSGGEN